MNNAPGFLYARSDGLITWTAQTPPSSWCAQSTVAPTTTHASVGHAEARTNNATQIIVATPNQADDEKETQ
jgi:hypothetical protein